MSDDNNKPGREADGRFAKGNQLWSMGVQNSGRHKRFRTPEDLWNAACEYFQWSDDHPLMEVDFKGRDADKVTIPRMRPYTALGFCIYIGASPDWWYKLKQNLVINEMPGNADYLQVIAGIEAVIREQKFTGAAAGFLNATIISRDLGLADHTEMKLSGQIERVWGQNPDEEKGE